MAVNNPSSSGGGGAAQVSVPGYGDYAGAVWACHFDEETAGTWTAAIGNDVVRQGAAATAVLTEGPRPVCNLQSGLLLAAAQASAVILGDSTLIACVRLSGSSTSGAQPMFMVGGTAGAAPADNISNNLMFSSGRLRGDWQQGFLAGAGNSWTGTASPTMATIGGGWHVYAYRRDVSANTLVFNFDTYQSPAVAYTNDPTDGANGRIAVGDYASPGSPLIGAQIAGAAIYDSVLTDAAVAEIVDQLRRGASKV